MTMISSRGRYALRVMTDLAINGDGNFIPMKDVAARQNISLKYLEQIMPVLSKNGLLETAHGKGGGYRLKRKPSQYTLGEILRLTEGDLAPVSCLTEDASPCERRDICRSVRFWQGLNEAINNYIDGYTLEELIKG